MVWNLRRVEHFLHFLFSWLWYYLNWQITGPLSPQSCKVLRFWPRFSQALKSLLNFKHVNRPTEGKHQGKCFAGLAPECSTPYRITPFIFLVNLVSMKGIRLTAWVNMKPSIYPQSR